MNIKGSYVSLSIKREKKKTLLDVLCGPGLDNFAIENVIGTTAEMVIGSVDYILATYQC